jgi:hypothetical protein
MTSTLLRRLLFSYVVAQQSSEAQLKRRPRRAQYYSVSEQRTLNNQNIRAITVWRGPHLNLWILNRGVVAYSPVQPLKRQQRRTRTRWRGGSTDYSRRAMEGAQLLLEQRAAKAQQGGRRGERWRWVRGGDTREGVAELGKCNTQKRKSEDRDELSILWPLCTITCEHHN